MSQDKDTGSLFKNETEAEYLERKMKEYLATRERNLRKAHFDYSRRKQSY